MAVSVNASKTGLFAGAPFAGTGTFAQMKAIASPADGVGWLVTNYGRGGSMWRYSASVGDWFPTAPVLIYENTALLSGVAQLAAQTLLSIPVEANLLANKRFRVLVTTAKSGTTDTITPSIRMGSAGTTADASVGGIGGMSGTNRSNGTDTWFRMASSTSAVRLGGGVGASFENSPITVATNTATTVADVTAANFISISCTMSGTTDTPQLGYTAVEIMA
jgi:hypothetical protein